MLLTQESPEPVHWTEIANLVRQMDSPVMVRPINFLSVKLWGIVSYIIYLLGDSYSLAQVRRYILRIALRLVEQRRRIYSVINKS